MFPRDQAARVKIRRVPNLVKTEQSWLFSLFLQPWISQRNPSARGNAGPWDGVGTREQQKFWLFLADISLFARSDSSISE